MKKIFSFIVILLLCITLSGCGCSKKNKKLDSIRYEFNHNSSAAEKVIIEQSREGIVQIEEETNKKDCSKKEGCKFTTYYNIKGIKKCNTKVTFIKKRLTDVKVLKKRIYNITVDKDLKITETHKDRSND